MWCVVGALIFDKCLALHEAPKLRKPPVGPNPYAKDDLAGEASLVRRERRKTDFASALFTPEATYDFALQIMQDDDQVTWRRLLRAAVGRAAELTRKWMKENPEVRDSSLSMTILDVP
jgi:hypothetical protein